MDVLQAIDHRDDGLPTHLVQLGLRYAFLQKPIDDLEVGPLDGRRISPGIADPTQPSQADVAYAHDVRIDGVDEFPFLAELIPQQGAVAGA